MRKRICISLISTVIVLAASLAIMVYNGIILLNNPSENKFPVRGIDVSEYQGEIDWKTLANQHIDFAFIKATEGSGYTDSCFEYNFSEVQKTSLEFSAYHFFSYDSTGKTQADNFINTVGNTYGTLPPLLMLNFMVITTKLHLIRTM